MVSTNTTIDADIARIQKAALARCKLTCTEISPVNFKFFTVNYVCHLLF